MTEEQLIQLLENNGLGKYQDDFLRFTKNTIFIKRQRLTNEVEIPLGHSKMGGNPDLPTDFVWPMFEKLPLTFMAQFRLSDLAAYDTDHELPQNGMLYFFYEASGQPWGGYEERDGHRIFFVPDETITLVRQNHPNQSGKYEYTQIEAQPACKVTMENGLTIPIHDGLFMHRKSIWNTQEEDLYWKMVHANDTRHKHHLLGTPDEIQGDMTVMCELAQHNLVGKPLDDSQRQQVQQAAKDWQLLFQLDTDEQNLNVMWGDVGMVYFFIRTPDLQNRIFGNTWAFLECY